MRSLQTTLALLTLAAPLPADVYLVRFAACPSALAGPGELTPVSEDGGRFYVHRVSPGLVVRHASPTRRQAEDARATAIALTARASGI